jgi:hypothetical protein
MKNGSSIVKGVLFILIFGGIISQLLNDLILFLQGSLFIIFSLSILKVIFNPKSTSSSEKKKKVRQT